VTRAPVDPHGVIAAAQLVVADPTRVSESRLRERLQDVRERKMLEHGDWHDAELAVLGALGAKRRVEEGGSA